MRDKSRTQNQGEKIQSRDRRPVINAPLGMLKHRVPSTPNTPKPISQLKLAPADDESFGQGSDPANRPQSQQQEAVVRAIPALLLLDRILNPGKFQIWLEQQNARFSGHTPVDLLMRGRWSKLVEMVDDFHAQDTCKPINQHPAPPQSWREAVNFCPQADGQPERYVPTPGELRPCRDILHQMAEQSMKAAEGGGISPEAAGRLLGVPKLDVLNLWSEGRLIAWTERETVWLPVWQFTNEKVLAGVKDVLRVYRSRDDWQVMRFFLGWCYFFGHRRPIDLIRANETACLVEYVKTFAKRTRGKLIDLPEFALGHDDEMLLRVPDLVEMRGWRPERATTRMMVLLAFLIQGWKCNRQIKPWLERANSQVNGESPAELIMRGEWSILANLIDGLLTEDPIVQLKGGDALP